MCIFAGPHFPARPLSICRRCSLWIPLGPAFQLYMLYVCTYLHTICTLPFFAYFFVVNASGRDRQWRTCNSSVVIACNNYLNAGIICVRQTGGKGLRIAGGEWVGREKWSKVGKAIYSSTGLNIFHNFMIITMASTIITMIIIFMCAVAKWGNFKFL